MKPALGLAFVAAIASVAACSPPDKPILRGQLDLPVAQGDKWKLCADDGMEDTTPNADCVLAPEVDPMKGYREALAARGWAQVETAANDLETWARGADPAGQCARLDITGVGERFAAKMYTLLRFELTETAC